MEKTIVFYLVFGLYMAAILYIGLFAWQRFRARDIEGYLLGGRAIDWFVLCWTLAATQFSALSFMGFLGYWYRFGVPSYTAIATGMYWIVSVSTWFLAPRIWKLGRAYGHITGGDLLGHFYQSKALQCVYGVIMVIAVIPYLQVQMSGVGYLLEVGSGGSLPFWVGAVLIYLVIILYTFFGGFRAVAFTDVLQGIVMTAGVVAAALLLVYWIGDGIPAAFKAVATTTPERLTVPGWKGVFDWTFLVSWVLPVGLGWITHPHMWVRAHAGSTLKVARLTPLFAFGVSFFIYSFGLLSAMMCLQLLPGNEAEADKILIMAVAKYFPVLFLAIICAAGAAAMMSSLDSQLLGLATLCVRDFFGVLRPQASKDTLLAVSHYLVLAFGFIGLILVFVNPGLLTTVGAFSSVLGVQALPGLVLALFNVRWFTKHGVLVGMVAGFVGVFVFGFGPLKNYLGIYAGSWGLIINLALLVVVSALTQGHRVSEEQVKTYKRIGW
jgi:SSS family solute:Na+ symporter